jgi:hypothetical protein
MNQDEILVGAEPLAREPGIRLGHDAVPDADHGGTHRLARS